MKLGYEDNGDGTAKLTQGRSQDDPLGQRPVLTIKLVNPIRASGDQMLVEIRIDLQLAKDIIAGLELLDTVRRAMPVSPIADSRKVLSGTYRYPEGGGSHPVDAHAGGRPA